MRSHRLIALMGSLALVAFSGCIGDDAELATANTVAPPPAPTALTGSLTGTVVSWDYLPLEGAVVTLYDAGSISGETQTDTLGRFTLNDLDPAKYRADVLAPGFTGTSRTVDITAGAVADLNVVLEERPRDNVSYILQDDWSGFLGCGVGVPLVSFSICSDVYEDYGLDQNDDFVETWEVNKGIREIVFGATWKRSGGVSAERLLFEVYVDRPDSGATTPWVLYTSAVGTSPIVFRMNDTTAEGNGFPISSFQDGQRIQLRAYVPRDGATVVYQQPFTVYWEEYYRTSAPPGRDPIPDL